MLSDDTNSNSNSAPERHWLCRPWWGYACLCLTGMLALNSVAGMLLLLGLDLQGLADGLGGLLFLLMFGCLVLGLVVRRRLSIPASTDRTWVRPTVWLAAISLGAMFLSVLIPAFSAARDVEAENAAERDTTWKVQALVDGLYSLQVPSTRNVGTVVGSL